MNKVLHLNDSCYLSDSGGHSPDQSWADMHDPAAAFSGFPLSSYLPQFTHWKNEARGEYMNLVGSLYRHSRQCMFHRWWFDVGCAALISLRLDGTQHDMIWYFLDSAALQHVFAHCYVMGKTLGGRCSEARSETVRTNSQVRPYFSEGESNKMMLFQTPYDKPKHRKPDRIPPTWSDV